MGKKLGNVKNGNDLKMLLEEDNVGKGFRAVFTKNDKMKQILQKLGI